MEVVATIRIIEYKLNELKSKQLNKNLLENTISTSIISSLALLLHWIISNITTTMPAFGRVLVLANSDPQPLISVECDDPEVLKEAVEWFEGLRKAFEIMLKACGEKHLEH